MWLISSINMLFTPNHGRAVYVAQPYVALQIIEDAQICKFNYSYYGHIIVTCEVRAIQWAYFMLQ